MGNCAGICKSKILGLKGDIILEKNTNNETGKYLETDNIQKIMELEQDSYTGMDLDNTFTVFKSINDIFIFVLIIRNKFY